MSIPTNTGYEDLMNELARLRNQLDKAEAENDKLRGQINESDDSGFKDKFRQLRKELEEADDDRQTLKSLSLIHI